MSIFSLEIYNFETKIICANRFFSSLFLICKNYPQVPGINKKLDKVKISVKSNPEKSLFVSIQL